MKPLYRVKTFSNNYKPEELEKRINDWLAEMPAQATTFTLIGIQYQVTDGKHFALATYTVAA